MTIDKLIESMPGYGAHRMRLTLQGVELGEKRLVCETTERQRKILAATLDA